MVGVEILPEKLMFMLAFLVVLVITFIKIYNVMNSCEKYGFDWMWLLFIIFVISYGINLFIYLNMVDQMAMLALFRLETLLVVLNVIFLGAELLYGTGIIGRNQFRDKYRPETEAPFSFYK